MDKIENLYRGKKVYNHEWVEGNLIQNSDGIGYIIPFEYIDNDGHHLRIDSDEPVFTIQETICQFSGIIDNEGIKIFEDDLRITNDKGIIFRIYRVAGGFVFKDSIWMKDINDLVIGDDLIFTHLTDAQTLSWLVGSTTHYGNIYENF